MKIGRYLLFYRYLLLYSKWQKNNFVFTGTEKDEPDKLDNMGLEYVSLAQGIFSIKQMRKDTAFQVNQEIVLKYPDQGLDTAGQGNWSSSRNSDHDRCFR